MDDIISGKQFLQMFFSNALKLEEIVYYSTKYIEYWKQCMYKVKIVYGLQIKSEMSGRK